MSKKGCMSRSRYWMSLVKQVQKSLCEMAPILAALSRTLTTIKPRTKHKARRIYQHRGDGELLQSPGCVIISCSWSNPMWEAISGHHEGFDFQLWVVQVACAITCWFSNTYSSFILCFSSLDEFPQRWPPETSHPLTLTFWHPSVIETPFVRLILRVSLLSAPRVFIQLSVLVWHCLPLLWNLHVSLRTVRCRGLHIHDYQVAYSLLW